MQVSLKQKLMGAFVGVVAVPTLILFGVNSVMMRGAITDAHEDKVRQDAEMIATRTLPARAEVALNYTRFLAAEHASASGGLDALVSRGTKDMHLSFVELTTVDGEVVSSSAEGRVGKRVEAVARVADLEQAPQLTVDFLPASRLFQLHAAALVKKAGTPVGIVHAGYLLDGDFLRSLARDVQVSLFTPDGGLSASSGDVALDGALASRAFQSTAAACRDNPGGPGCTALRTTSGAQQVNGANYLVLAAPLALGSGTPWGTLVLARDARGMDADMARARNVSIFITLLAGLSAALIGFLLSRRLVNETGLVVHDLERDAKKVLETAAQQSTLATQQAAAIHETSTTAAEIAQTSKQATDHADAVIQLAQRSEDLSRDGKTSVEDATSSMESLSDQVKAIAQRIGELSERATQIGEINATVKDLAEQSNLLALNASIEAAKAGEHGKGFNVVAMEMRNLAEQSKLAAGQVRGLISELQKEMRLAIGATEEGSKKAQATVALARNAGSAISGLADVIRESSLAARQIASNTRQQTIGVEQIVRAVADSSSAMNDNLAGTRQIEEVARSLTSASQRLSELMLSGG